MSKLESRIKVAHESIFDTSKVPYQNPTKTVELLEERLLGLRYLTIRLQDQVAELQSDLGWKKYGGI